MSDGISINKFISSKGMCSRREADTWIEQGMVLINGKVARKGNRVMPQDEVRVHGQLIKTKSTQRPVYILLNKPKDVTCTTDQSDKSNIIDFINYKKRIFPVGRLDKDSTGLIMLTNDGDIINKILRKENKQEKEYIVKVKDEITDEFIKKMSKPIPMLGTKTIPGKINQLGPYTFRIVLTQGLNRQIRRMVYHCGNSVKSLKRSRIMHLKLNNLAEGQWRYLTDEEIKQMHQLLNG